MDGVGDGFSREWFWQFYNVCGAEDTYGDGHARAKRVAPWGSIAVDTKRFYILYAV